MVPVPFAQGASTKTDPKQLQMGKLLVCQNATFNSPGKLSKRPGQKTLSGITGVGKGMSVLSDELVTWTGNKLYSYNPSGDVQVAHGTLQSPIMQSDWCVRNQNSQSWSDGVANATIRVYVYEDSRGGAYYTVVDAKTNQTITEVAIANGARPRAILVGTSVAVIYRNTSDNKLYVIGIPVANPTAPIAATIIVTTLNVSNPFFAVCSDGATGFVVWNSSTSTTMSLGSLNSSLALTGPASITATINAALDASVLGNAAYVGIAWYDGSAVQYRVADYQTLTAVLSTTLVETIGNVNNVCVTDLTPLGGYSAGDVQIAYSVGTTAPTAKLRYTNYVSAVMGPHVDIMKGLYLFAKSFIPSGSDAIVYPCAQTGILPQDQYFLLRSDGKAIARTSLSAATRGTGTSAYYLQQSSFDGTNYHLVLEYARVLTPLVDNTSTGSPSTPTGASNIQVSQVGVAYGLFNFFDQQKSFTNAELAQSLNIAGAMGMMYDGASVVEQGFNHWPYSLSAASAGSGTSKTAAGVYWYAATYEWTDQNGRIHQSAPSFAVSYTQGANAFDVNVTVPTLRNTLKSNVSIVLWRTTNAGTTFYRVSKTANDTTADTVVVLDNVTDASIQYGPYLYTLGGVLENDPLPACAAVTTWQGRLAYLPSEGDGLSYGISKVVAPGHPVECSTSLLYPVDPRGGKMTALGALDDKLVLFKTSTIFVQTGRGPSPTGSGDDLAANPAQLLTTDVGCTNQRSVVSTPDGLMFQSQKGIYLLNRSLQVSYVGADVEAFNQYSIVSAVLVASLNQVRFGLSNGQALVYDYFTRQWASFTNYSQVAATNWNGQYTILRADGGIRQDDPTTFLDNGAYVPMLVKTAWIQMGGVQGYQRVWKVFILGEWKSAHTLNVGLAYDYNDNQVQQIQIAAADPGSWGSSATWGSDVVWGGGSGDGLSSYQYSASPSRQKCQAIQVTLQDTGSAGEGMSLSSLGFLVGVLPQGARLPAARRFG
jgi:hypothetical protein